MVREENRLAPLLTGGVSGENWKVEGLYRHEKFHRAELFGQYEKDFWDTKLSVSYGFTRAHLAAALEAGVNLWFLLKPRMELKTGYASESFSFHPNYNVGLFLWNYLISAPSCFKGKDSSSEVDKSSSSSLWIEEGCINDVVYFAPRLVFSFWEETVKVAPQFVAGWMVSEKRFNYELYLEMKYNLESFLTLRAQGGVFYEKKKMNFGFLTQAAVEF